MFRTLTLMSAALLMAACASAPPPPPAPAATSAAAQAPAEQACTREFPVGSTIAVTRCRSKEQSAADKTAADATAQSIRDTSRVMRDPAAGTR